ncbi:MAG TPA: hypothetical protein PK978_05610 [Paludibacter sp.]|nr:hypothetical protein [Paludibacter sp.]
MKKQLTNPENLNLPRLRFEYLKPFRTSDGNFIRMRALVTIFGKQYVEDESRKRHPADTVTPATEEEYQSHLDYLEEMSMLD